MPEVKKTPNDFAEFVFHQGTNYEAYQYFGSHPAKYGRSVGAIFRVWAPHAKSVSVVGDFNEWDREKNPMTQSGEIWYCFIPRIKQYDLYKYSVEGVDGEIRLKADPYAFHAEEAPGTASKFYDISGMSGMIMSGKKKIMRKIFFTALLIFMKFIWALGVDMKTEMPLATPRWQMN